MEQRDRTPGRPTDRDVHGRTHRGRPRAPRGMSRVVYAAAAVWALACLALYAWQLIGIANG